MMDSARRHGSAAGSGKPLVMGLSILSALCVAALLYLMFVPQRQMSNELRDAKDQLTRLTNQNAELRNQIAMREGEAAPPAASTPPAPGKTLLGTMYFNSGDIQLTTSGLKTLQELGPALKAGGDQIIVVEGHADNVVIGQLLRQQFSSNLELSAARAIRVANFLERKLGIPPRRIAVAAFSEYHPVADNASTQERRRNRRVEIYLQPGR